MASVFTLFPDEIKAYSIKGPPPHEHARFLTWVKDFFQGLGYKHDGIYIKP
jgi:hypothetical protein